MGRNAIQRGEIQGRLQRGLHLKESSPAPHVADVIVPVIMVEDMSRIDDNIQLSDQRPFGATAANGAQAGLFSVLQLGNVAQVDPKANKVVVVDKLYVNTIVNYRVGIDVNGTLSTPGANRDARYTPLFGSTAQVGSQAVAAVSTSQILEIPASRPWMDDPFVLPAGFMIVVWAAVVNTGITVSFVWREFDTVVK